MDTCGKYFEMISQLIDGELSAQQESELRTHMGNCPDCAKVYEAFSGISQGMDLEIRTAPEGFASGVMSRINKEEKNNRRKKQSPWKTVLPLAACLALVFVVAQSTGIFGGKSANDTAAPENRMFSGTYDAGSAADAAPHYDSEFAEQAEKGAIDISDKDTAAELVELLVSGQPLQNRDIPTAAADYTVICYLGEDNSGAGSSERNISIWWVGDELLCLLDDQPQALYNCTASADEILAIINSYLP